MFRTINIIVFCFLVGSVAGCASLSGSNGKHYTDINCHFSANAPDGWTRLETLPPRYKTLPGIEAGEEILQILSSPDGSGIILFTSEKTAMPMYEFQKKVYDLMTQREKTFKKNKNIKKYRCMNSYKTYGDLFGIDSYYEFWKLQDNQGKVKGTRRTYFISCDDNSICTVSKVLYSNFEKYDSNLVSFSDITISENN